MSLLGRTTHFLLVSSIPWSSQIGGDEATDGLRKAYRSSLGLMNTSTLQPLDHGRFACAVLYEHKYSVQEEPRAGVDLSILIGPAPRTDQYLSNTAATA